MESNIPQRTSISDRYQQIQKIGSGRFGRVYKVRDTKNNTIKAEKVIEGIKEQDIKQINMFALMDHPNIIKIYKNESYIFKYQHPGTKQTVKDFHIIMEYIDGVQLESQLKQYSSVQKLLDIYEQIKSAIQYLNERKIVHRDIKLNNIIIMQGRIKIVDFGLASQVSLSLKSTKGQGTIYYMAPQIFRDLHFSMTSDLYSVGVLLVELSIGKLINQTPGWNPQKFKQFVVGLKLDKRLERIILPLIQQDYKQRSFYGSRLNLCNQKLDNQMLRQKLEQYKDLIELNVSNCGLNDDCANIINGKCKSLIKLDVSGNNLTDNFLLFALRKFLIYDYKNNKNLSFLLRLSSLKIAVTNITDESLMLISKYALSLQHLDISYTKVTSEQALKVVQQRKLLTLAIWSGRNYYLMPYNYKKWMNQGGNYNKWINNKTKIDKNWVKQISKIKLREISADLDGLNVDDVIKGLDRDASCIQIGANLNKQSVRIIIQKKKLQQVFIRRQKELEISRFQSKLLRSVGLVNCNINIISLVEKLSQCKYLKELNLQFNKIGDQGAIKIAENLKQLTILQLSCNQISNQGAIKIAENLKQLTTLYLSTQQNSIATNQINKQGAIKIGENLKQLKTLNLSQNNIGNQGAINIAENLKQLTILDLSTNQINKQGAIKIAENLKQLKTLNLSQNNIGNQGAINIAENLNQLTILYLNDNNIEQYTLSKIRQSLKFTQIYI